MIRNKIKRSRKELEQGLAKYKLYQEKEKDKDI
jgi:hypothetical protein